MTRHSSSFLHFSNFCPVTISQTKKCETSLFSGDQCPHAASPVAGVSWVQKDPLACARLLESGVSRGEDTSKSAEQAVEQTVLAEDYESGGWNQKAFHL